MINKKMAAGSQENFEGSSFLGDPKLSTIYGHKRNLAGGFWSAGFAKTGKRFWL
ncbi:MAG: hypothetical protein Q8L27_05145 [archaeon]|nr:hypothetical protein [archaeon]